MIIIAADIINARHAPSARSELYQKINFEKVDLLWRPHREAWRPPAREQRGVPFAQAFLGLRAFDKGNAFYSLGQK